MIRTEIDITNPQKVEVIATGEIGYVTLYDEEDYNSPFLVSRKNGEEIDWCKSEQLRPLEDEKLVFAVSSFDDERIYSGANQISFHAKEIPHTSRFSPDEYTFQVIATPKIEDSEAKKFLEDFDPQIKEVGYDNYSYTPEQVIERLEAFKKLLNN